MAAFNVKVFGITEVHIQKAIYQDQLPLLLYIESAHFFKRRIRQSQYLGTQFLQKKYSGNQYILKYCISTILYKRDRVAIAELQIQLLTHAGSTHL